MQHTNLRTLLVSGVLLACGLLWALWPVLGVLADRWATEPRYAHGYLVPIFSLVLLWMRRARLKGGELAPSNWGLAFLALGVVFQLVGGYFLLPPIEALALIPYLTGAVLLLGGLPLLQWSWLSIAFLLFMIPLPWRLESAVEPKLQAIATTSSMFILQCLGLMAVADGNVIQLNDTRIGVVEACSGLSMLITFIALSTALALVIDRPLWDRIALVLSSIPVALIANIARITLTGVLLETMGGAVADTFYHDLAGWLMIPFALFLFWIEIQIFSKLIVEEKDVASAVGVSRPDLSKVVRNRPPKDREPSAL